MDILSAIGNTSMVQLRRLVPPGCAHLFVKLEGENPSGSIKAASPFLSESEFRNPESPGKRLDLG